MDEYEVFRDGFLAGVRWEQGGRYSGVRVEVLEEAWREWVAGQEAEAGRDGEAEAE